MDDRAFCRILLGACWALLCLVVCSVDGVAAPPLAGASPDEIVLPRFTFSVDSLRVTRRGEFDDIELWHAVHQEFQDRLGHPSLPTLKLDILVPADKRISRVEVEASSTVELSESVLPRPIQRSPELDGTIPRSVPPDTSLYNSATPYPAVLGEVTTNGSMRGYRLGTVVVHPVQYVGARHHLILNRVLDITVHFETLSAEERASMIVRDQARRRNTLEQTEIEWLRRFVRNPEDLDRFYGGVDEREGEMVQTPFGGFDPTPLPSLDGPPVEYVIITDSLTVDGVNIGGQVVTEFQRLADWKTSKGTPAVVRTVTWVRSNYSGIDDAARIRNFLIDAFRLWGTDYALLAGDLRVVPGRRFSGANEGGGLPFSPGHPPADVYFGGLDSDWDKDNDGLFGESGSDITASDPFWDIWVGRVPLDTKEEAKSFVDRTLTYARAPSENLTQIKASYYERILLMAGLTNSFQWNNELNGIFISESIARKFEAAGFTAQRHYQALAASGVGCPGDTCLYKRTQQETSPHNPLSNRQLRYAFTCESRWCCQYDGGRVRHQQGQYLRLEACGRGSNAAVEFCFWL